MTNPLLTIFGIGGLSFVIFTFFISIIMIIYDTIIYLNLYISNRNNNKIKEN